MRKVWMIAAFALLALSVSGCANARYDSIAASVQKQSKAPSFFSKSAGKAQNIELAWDGEKYTATLTDTNNVLSDYLFSASVPGIRFSVNGNKLTITADTAPSDTVTITAEKRNSQRRGVITWTDGVYDPNGKLQDTVTDAQTVSDPVKGYLNIKVSYGSAKIVKTSEDGKVEGISFTVTGNGVNKTVQTGAGGVIQIDNLAPGVYTVTEQSYDKYEPQEVRRVTVVSGQVATVNFNNTLKRGDLTVTKSDAETGLPQGDASLAGAVYGIYKGEQLVDTYTTDANGQFTKKYYVCGDDWSVRKITPSEGYSLVEVFAPYGYTLSGEPVYFDVTADNATEENAVTVVEVTKPNTAQKGVIKISKSGEVFSSVTEADGLYQPVFSVQGLPGAVYEIAAAEDLAAADGTLRASAGEVVNTVTTDETDLPKAGRCISENMKCGVRCR